MLAAERHLAVLAFQTPSPIPALQTVRAAARGDGGPRVDTAGDAR